MLSAERRIAKLSALVDQIAEHPAHRGEDDEPFLAEILEKGINDGITAPLDPFFTRDLLVGRVNEDGIGRLKAEALEFLNKILLVVDGYSFSAQIATKCSKRGRGSF